MIGSSVTQQKDFALGSFNSKAEKAINNDNTRSSPWYKDGAVINSPAVQLDVAGVGLSLLGGGKGPVAWGSYAASIMGCVYTAMEYDKGRATSTDVAVCSTTTVIGIFGGPFLGTAAGLYQLYYDIHNERNRN